MLARAIGTAASVIAIAAAVSCTKLDDLATPACAISVSPTSIDAGSQGSTGTLTIKAPDVCAWTVETTAAWVTLTGARAGTGNGSVAYEIAAHEGFDARSASISVGGQSIAVSQPGRPIPIICAIAVTPLSWPYTWEGGPGSIAVAAQPGCAWTAVSQVPWITITANGRGSGTGTFGFTVAVNAGEAARTGTLVGGGHTITITQGKWPATASKR